MHWDKNGCIILDKICTKTYQKYVYRNKNALNRIIPSDSVPLSVVI
jgi:hypothetical protein